jgi:TrmH family RNA methyltransferase
VLVLDGVQDPGNVGTIARVGAALGGAAVLLSEGCADPFHWAAVRGSAGAVFRLPLERGCDVEAVVGRVRRAGGEVWATGSSGLAAESWRPKDPALLLLGAEGRGLDRAAAALADGTVWIRLAAEVESLNVAVAAGILLDSFRRTRRAE